MQIKKKQLSRRARAAVIILLVLLFAASLGGVYYIHRAPAVLVKQVPVYNYGHEGIVTCKAHIRPNMVFQDTILGPGETIYTNLLESFSAICSYRFNADKPAELKGTYSVTATLDAKDMWSLDYVLVPQTRFSEKGKSFSFSREFPVDLAYFHEVLRQVNEQLGVNAREPKIIIKENVSIEAVTPEGTVKEELAPAMIIPVTTGAFEVEGGLPEQKSGALSKTVAAPNPLKDKLGWALISACVSGLLAALFAALTENKPFKEAGPRKKEAEFWRKHGERVVRAKGEVVPREAIFFGSMEDLVKVADELGRPIIYHEGSPGAPPACSVFDGPTAYSYCLDSSESEIHRVGKVKRARFST